MVKETRTVAASSKATYPLRRHALSAARDPAKLSSTEAEDLGGTESPLPAMKWDSFLIIELRGGCT